MQVVSMYLSSAIMTNPYTEITEGEKILPEVR
jgi:hypothetical protein